MDAASLNHLFEYKDGALLWKNPRARRCKAGMKAGSIGSDGYLYVAVFGKKMPVHRVVWAMHNGSLLDYLDHINGDRTDNRIENLRIATRQENSFNKAVRSDNQTGITGVRWHSQRQKWNARIKVNGREKSLGNYLTKCAAENARLAAELKYFGIYSRNYQNLMKLVDEGQLVIQPAE